MSTDSIINHNAPLGTMNTPEDKLPKSNHANSYDIEDPHTVAHAFKNKAFGVSKVEAVLVAEPSGDATLVDKVAASEPTGTVNAQAVTTPAAAAAAPTTPVAAPTTPAAAPTTPVAAPTTPVAAPTIPVAAPTTPVAAPTTPVAAPTTPVAAPTTLVAAPTTPAAAPTTPVAAPTTPVAAPTTPAAAPTTPAAAPTTPVAAPTTPVAPIINTPPPSSRTTSAAPIAAPGITTTAGNSLTSLPTNPLVTATTTGSLPTISAPASTDDGHSEGINGGVIGAIVGVVVGAMLLLAAVTAFIRRKKSRARDTRASRTMDEIFAPTSGNKDYNYGNEETASAWESPRPTERAVDASMPTEYANNAPGGMGYDAGHQQNMNYYDNGHGQAYNDNYRGAAPQTYLPQLSDQTFAGVTSPVMNYSGLANTSPETAAATAAGIPMKHLDPHRQQEDAYYQENYDHQDPYQGYHNAPSGVPGAVAAQGATVYDNHGMTHQGYADPSMPQHQGHYDEYAYNAGYGHDGYYQEQPYDRHHYGNVEQDMYADQAGYSHGFQNSHQEPSSAANMNYSGASGLPSDGHRAPPTPMDQQHAYTEASAGPYDEQMANHQYYTSQSGYPQSSAKPNATEGQPASENRLNAH